MTRASRGRRVWEASFVAGLARPVRCCQCQRCPHIRGAVGVAAGSSHLKRFTQSSDGSVETLNFWLVVMSFHYFAAPPLHVPSHLMR